MRSAFALFLLGACLLPYGAPLRAAGEPNGPLVQLPQNFSQQQCFGGKSGNGKDDMQFSLVDVPHGKAFLAWGEIASGDTARFSDALDAAGPVQAILLCSNGGSLEDGIDIGYLVREHKLATQLPPGFVCISACNFIFMGGVIRTVEPGAKFMVHMFESQAMQGKLESDTARQDWTIGYYALTHPDGMVGLEHDSDFLNLVTNYPQFSVAFTEAHMDLVQADLQRYQEAHPQVKESIQDFLKTDVARADITSAVLRNFAIEEDIKAIEQDSAQTAAQIAEFLVKMELSLHFLTAFSNIPNDAPRALTPAELAEYNITNTQ